MSPRRTCPTIQDEIRSSASIKFSTRHLLEDDNEGYDLLTRFSGTIVAEDEAFRETCVGNLTGVLVHLGNALEGGPNAFDLMDTTRELHEFYDALFDLDEDGFREELEISNFEHDLLVIHSVEVKKAYRGHGLGLLAVRRAIKTFGGGCALAALKPFPIQFTGILTEKNMREFELAEEKLRLYWGRLGFKQAGRSDCYYLDLGIKEVPIDKVLAPE